LAGRCSAAAFAADFAPTQEFWQTPALAGVGKKYSVDNPNLDLIRKLRNAGVDVAVCGQAVAEHRNRYEGIAPEVTLALSALATITILEHEGYALTPL
jgi:intracellular sulfur oxidation DsrE/DsrF family protein